MPNDKDFKADIHSKTAAEWTAIDPYLSKNDLHIESDTGKAKIGDGQKWSDTSYLPSLSATGITAIVALTQAAYDALSPKSATTLYVIT